MTIELSMLVPHMPSICHEDQAPDFQKDMANQMKEVAKKIHTDIKPDAIVLVSCHWPSTFSHYVDCTPVHKGTLTAFEAPELIKDVPYHYPGDQGLAEEIVKAGQEGGIEVQGVNDPYYLWDYGTLVPLRYLDPEETIPVISLSVTLAASLEETYKWGKIIADVLEKSDKKVIFASSGALSHNLVRGRHHEPTRSEHAMDKQFIEYIMNQDYQSAYDMLPQYARLAKVESGGRHLAMLLSVLRDKWEAEYLADGQSSGSWNALITFGSPRIKDSNLKNEEEYVK